MDAGSRKFGVALVVVTGAVAAGQWWVALGAFALYTVANVLLKLNGRDPEPAE